MDAAALAVELERRLRPLGTPERAVGERRYLKSSLTHLGVRLPALRTTTRQLLGEHPRAELGERLELVEALWAAPVFELRAAAVQVLERSSSELSATDLALIERLVREAHTWALVDPLSTAVVGVVLQRDPAARDVLDRWIGDDDFWVRRAALLAHLPVLRLDRSRFPQFAAYADRVLDEREFFVRKAVGWVLREVGKRDPELVSDWLAARTQRAAGVTMREAVKYLPEADRERLMAAYRNKVPAAG